LETANPGCVESKWEGKNGDSRQCRPKPDKHLKLLSLFERFKEKDNQAGKQGSPRFCSENPAPVH
jgi:hypothetical protein